MPMISAFLNWEYKQWIKAHSPKKLEQHARYSKEPNANRQQMLLLFPNSISSGKMQKG